MDRLRDMRLEHRLLPLEIGDGARRPSDAVVGARGEPQVLHGGLEQPLRGTLERAVDIEFLPAEDGIRSVAPLTNGHPFACREYALPEIVGRCAGARRTECLEADGADLDMKVDPVEKRSREPADVALLRLPFARRTGESALMLRVHRRDQHRAGGKPQRAARA